MDHVIKVSFDNTSGAELVFADPNPLPANGQNPLPGPGDTVTWLFDEATVGKRDLQVLFQQYADDSPALSHLLPCSPLGPFDSLTLGVGKIVGTVRFVEDNHPSRSFFYKLVEDGKELTWKNPAPGAPDKLLGGEIKHPPTPP